jgi:hypothetical protein
MFATRDVLLFALVAGLLAAAGGATAVGFAAWNLVISHANATGLDADAPVIALSWQDVGSGVLAVACTALALGLLTDREEPARRVVGAAAIAGLVAMVFDILVL